MSKAWIASKRDEFTRDILRDFCQVSIILEKAFIKFDRQQDADFEIFRELLGESMNKGLLWRLKDTAHFAFKAQNPQVLTGQYLDWAIGYIFHECMKIREDAYQLMYYAPWFCSMNANDDLKPEERLLCGELSNCALQTKESIEREIKRVRFILFQCRRLFILYLPLHADNKLLARFLFSQNDLVREVFKSSYDELTTSIYGRTPEKMFLLAAQSLKTGGWHSLAETAEKEAEKIQNRHKDTLPEEKKLDTFQKR
jgi:hypothetical protein